MLTVEEFIERAKARGMEFRATVGGTVLYIPGGPPIPLPAFQRPGEPLIPDFIRYVCEVTGLDPVDFDVDPQE